MDKWELARYLIDAKKCVDSVLFIAAYGDELRYIDLRKKTSELRSEFSIKCCVVLDKHLERVKIKKRDLCNQDELVQSLYYERDKNSAHKDESYLSPEFESLNEIAEQMKEQLIHIKSVCSDSLPDVVTLDFVPHDRELFRMLHGITASREDEINKRKYPFRDVLNAETSNGKTYPLFQDTEDLRKIDPSKRSDYAVILSLGINFYESIQTMQDGFIRMNVLHDENAWCSMNEKEMSTLIELTKLGCFDEFGIIQPPPNDPILLARIMKILET